MMIRKKRGWLFFTLAALLTLVLTGAGWGVFSWFSPHTPSASHTQVFVGNAFFVSSGQLREGYDQGINDELEINLHNISQPTPGQGYFAWLLSDKGASPQTALLLGQLPVNNGVVNFLYQGDAQHTNLIGTTSRFLMTENPLKSSPANPYTDVKSWRYYAELPQNPSPLGKHRRAIDTLRDLLYDASHLSPLGIHGGSDIRLLKESEKILEWASSARDAWSSKDAAFISRQIIRILDYLDGESLVGKEVLPGTLLLVDPMTAQVPLIDIEKNQPTLSYIDRMNNQLTGLAHQTGFTAEMHSLVIGADAALLRNVRSWLGRVHLDATQLVKMNQAQLLLPSTLSILDDLQTSANYALVGQLDPSTDQLQDGVVQIHNNIQRLVTFNVSVYGSH